MNITLVSHASVLIGTSDAVIWSDPWLFGTAFNESWSLHPAPSWDPSHLEDVDYLWLSHEHPDHFHVPTLRSLPDAFKKRITVLFQENNSEKMFDALRRLGFLKFRKLPHGKPVALTDRTRVYCYQVGQMDSALAVMNGGQTILNLNDCEVNRVDLQRIKRTLKVCDVLLNQFSRAGSNGYVDGDVRHERASARILDTMVANHSDVGAKVTIPIASFMYFSTDDNAYMNKYANTPSDVARRFAQEGLQAAILYPGDTLKVGERHDSAIALARFEAGQRALAEVPGTSAVGVPLETLIVQYGNLAGSIHKRYPSILLKSLRPVVIRIPDLSTTVRLSISAQTIEVVDAEDPDLEIRSQPLSFAFSNAFGFQTLGVSARYVLYKKSANWRKYRILFSLNNAELYLRPKLLFRTRNLRWFLKRLPGAANQLAYRLQRMS
jgi:UDP-MurNAc hydroxylase